MALFPGEEALWSCCGGVPGRVGMGGVPPTVKVFDCEFFEEFIDLGLWRAGRFERVLDEGEGVVEKSIIFEISKLEWRDVVRPLRE